MSRNDSIGNDDSHVDGPDRHDCPDRRARTDRTDRPHPGIPDALRRFVDLVDRGEFWESHEVLEGPWRENRSDFFQGLILYASAFVHVKRGNRHGIQAQLIKAEERLSTYPSAYLGIDLDGIRRHMSRCRQIVEDHPDADPDEWPGLIPFPELRLDADRVRGDEPEAGG